MLQGVERNQGRVKEQAAKDGAGSAVLGREAPGEGRQARVQSCGGTRAEAIETLRARIKKLKSWLKENEEKIGKSGKPRKSNLTDNERAKMKSSDGVIQGYDGVAAVDSKHQVVVHAEAFGQPQDHDL